MINHIFKTWVLSITLFSHLLYADIDFVRDVKPILEHNCVSCHRADKAEGDIRFDDKESAFSAEDLIVPGKPEDSSIYWTTTLPTDDDIFMPPIKDEDRDYPLTDSEKDFKRLDKIWCGLAG